MLSHKAQLVNVNGVQEKLGMKNAKKLTLLLQSLSMRWESQGKKRSLMKTRMKGMKPG
jgi:hypothetical protein